MAQFGSSFWHYHPIANERLSPPDSSFGRFVHEEVLDVPSKESADQAATTRR